MTTDVYVGIGSNLNSPKQQVLSALEDINRIKNTRLIDQSSLYQSSPMGPADQPDYINAVVKIETDLTASELLTELQLLENRHGRLRTAVRWQARSLDLDILAFGDNEIHNNTLNVPHPGLSQRNFVLYPLYEINPDLSIPGLGSVSQLKEQCDIGDLTKLELSNMLSNKE